MKIAVTSAILLLTTPGAVGAQPSSGIDGWWRSATEVTRKLKNVGSPDSPAEAYAKFGLVGTWANNCQEPPAARNFHVTYRPTEGGNVVSETDYGGATHARMVVREASIDGEGRLHATGFSTFEELPLPYQARLGKDGSRPRAKTEIVLAKAADGSIKFMEAATTAEGAPTEKNVTGGFTVNPQTGLAGPPSSSRFACNGPTPPALGTRIGVGQR